MRTGAWYARTDCAVIRILYKDFSAGTHDVAGLHGRVECCARGTTIYLLPGLTACQRRAVIRRLRQEASRGFSPALPLPQLAIALGLDRVQAAARTLGAIVRLHPAVTLVPSAFVIAMVTLFVMASSDRPGIAPGTRSALAAAVSGRSAGAVSARPGPARVTRVTAAEGACGTDIGGTGPGSGRLAESNSGYRERPKATPQARMAVWLGVWCACPQAVTVAAPRPRDDQLACRRPAPHTAQVPGPLDFAR